MTQTEFGQDIVFKQDIVFDKRSKSTVKNNLLNILEILDKDLFEVFDDLCLTYLLRPAHGSNGITFLYPKEKSYRQKIINSAYSANPDIAADMIRSLILQNNYSSSFENNVINLDQKLDIKATSEKYIVLENGLVLAFDKTFVPISNYTNMSLCISLS